MLENAPPNEGAMLWFDMLAIPTDAPQPSNAYLLMDYLMDPQIAAINARRIGNASANAAATGLLDASFATDPIIYPTPIEQRRLFVQTEDTPRAGSRHHPAMAEVQDGAISPREPSCRGDHGIYRPRLS